MFGHFTTLCMKGLIFDGLKLFYSWDYFLIFSHCHYLKLEFLSLILDWTYLKFGWSILAIDLFPQGRKYWGLSRVFFQWKATLYSQKVLTEQLLLKNHSSVSGKDILKKCVLDFIFDNFGGCRFPTLPKRGSKTDHFFGF